MQATQIKKIFKILHQDQPNPKTELIYVNTYTLLLAVILSAQATDKGVNKATEELFKKVQTPEAMVRLGEDHLRSFIKSIGLYKTKAKNIIAMSQMLIKEFNSEVPSRESDLILLPGVGLKTARVIQNVAFKKPTIAVDTHVFRVAQRLGLSEADTPEEMSSVLEKIIPPPYRQNAHHWLILHGRYVCKARTPLCNQCKINKFCTYPHKSKTAQ